MATDPHGLPVLNGIWHRNCLLIRYAAETDPALRRSLHITAEIPGFRPPTEAGRYPFGYHDRKPFPARDTEVICGTIHTDTQDLGFVMSMNKQSTIFLASFFYARPFRSVEIHGPHILALNVSEEVWRFDVSDPNRITAEILP